MKIEVTFVVDVEANYVPGCASSQQSDGTWEPGEGGQAVDLSVMLNGSEIVDLLDADALERVEDAWVEHYESNL